MFSIFKGFPQPKAIRDIAGFYHHEIYYPGFSSNSFDQQPLQLQDDQKVIATSSPQLKTAEPHTLKNRRKSVATSTVSTSATKNRSSIVRSTTETAARKQTDSPFKELPTHEAKNVGSQQEFSKQGVELTGVYEYNDGVFRRTVFYSADQDNGYRVTKEEVEPFI